MRVAIVTAEHHYDSPYDEASPVFENLGAESIAALLRAKGFHVDLFNESLEGIDRPNLVSALSEGGYPLVGFSAGYSNTRSAMKIARLLPDHVHKAFGGYSATLFPNQLVSEPCVDSVVIGEGEFPFLHLAAAIERPDKHIAIPNVVTKRGSSGLRCSPAGLDELPPPVRDELHKKQRRTQDCEKASWRCALISSSRGCGGNCGFCYAKEFYRRCGSENGRYREPKQVVDEVEDLVHGPCQISYVWFIDEDFIGTKPDRAAAIAREILARRLDVGLELDTRAENVDYHLFHLLKRAGLRKVFVGVESFAQPFLDRWNKNTRVETNLAAMDVLSRLDIEFIAGTIFFDDHTTMDELEQNARVLGERGPFCTNDIARTIKSYPRYDRARYHVPTDPAVNELYQAIRFERDRLFGELIASGETGVERRDAANRALGEKFCELVMDRVR